MANTDAPNGFTPAYHIYGGTIRPAEMRIASGTSTSIFSGDVVTLSSGYVTQAGATDTPIGVFYGVFFTATDGTRPRSSTIPTPASQSGARERVLTQKSMFAVSRAPRCAHPLTTTAFSLGKWLSSYTNPVEHL